MFLLDTNACIRLLNRDRTSPVAQRLAAVNPSQVRLCTVVVYELYYGAYKSERQERNLDRLGRFCGQFAVLDFDSEAARLAGEIRATLEREGRQISQNDLKIAAIAVVNGCTLVTHNTREFSRVRGLELEDWEIS